jgi:hypothetical protein
MDVVIVGTAIIICCSILIGAFIIAEAIKSSKP